MIYELMGRLMVKVLRNCLLRRTPVPGTVLAAVAATSVVAVVALLIASGDDSPEEV